MDCYAMAPDYAYDLMRSVSCLSKSNTDTLADAAYNITTIYMSFCLHQGLALE